MTMHTKAIITGLSDEGEEVGVGEDSAHRPRSERW